MTSHLPSIPPYGSAHYTFPGTNLAFPEQSAGAGPDPPKLLLAGCDDSYATWALHWSNPINVTSEHDMFVHLPTTSDVKVHVEKVGYTTHVFIDPVSRAEVSAKEIRSRLKGGKEKTVVVVETKRQLSDGSFRTPPVSPSSSTQSFTTPPSSKSSQDSAPPKNAKKKKEKTVTRCVIEGVAVCRSMVLTLLDESSNYNVIHQMLKVSGTKVQLSRTVAGAKWLFGCCKLIRKIVIFPNRSRISVCGEAIEEKQNKVIFV